jgi:NADPH-dependent glutamate synthase beta subunit-like oxidoreductase
MLTIHIALPYYSLNSFCFHPSFKSLYFIESASAIQDTYLGTTGLKVGDGGLLQVDATGHSSRDGIFAGGDVVTGAKTVVEAVVTSRGIAEAMDEYVREKYPETPS